MLSFPETTANLITLQIFFREMTFLFLLFIDANGTETLFTLFKNSNILQQFFSHDNFSQFVSTFGGVYQRKYLILMFAKLLFENAESVISFLTLPVYQKVLNSVMNNIYNRRKNFRIMRQSRTDNKLYLENVNNNTETTFKKIYQFRKLLSADKLKYREFIKNIRVSGILPKRVFIEKLNAFLQNSSVDPNQFLTPEHINNMNN